LVVDGGSSDAASTPAGVQAARNPAVKAAETSVFHMDVIPTALGLDPFCRSDPVAPARRRRGVDV
jgi:phage terminase small subunit